MPTWTFEPGHTAAAFRARHMMVTHVRGHFKNVRGSLAWDPEHPHEARVEVVIDAAGIWTGEPDRDAHLRSEDFLDVERHPEIRYRGDRVELVSENEWYLHGDLTLRGVTRPLTLDVRFLGTWPTPWWEDGVDHGPKLRAGFVATGRIDRHAFGVSWNDALDRGGVVVGDDVDITIDAEAVLDD